MSDVPFVYLMRREDGAWKIGFSGNPKARSYGLQTDFRMSFRLVRTWRHPDAYQIEQIAHRILRPYLDLKTSSKETFKAPKRVVIAAILEAIKVADTPPPVLVNLEPPPLPAEDLSAIEAAGGLAWAEGRPQAACPLPSRRERLAWCEGWRKAKVAHLIEQMLSTENGNARHT